MTDKELHLDKLRIQNPETMKKFEAQINKISSDLALFDLSNNEQARQEFIDTIMGFKEENSNAFSFECWKRVGHDIADLHKYKENQIAQGILNHFRDEIKGVNQ